MVTSVTGVELGLPEVGDIWPEKGEKLHRLVHVKFLGLGIWLPVSRLVVSKRNQR